MDLKDPKPEEVQLQLFPVRRVLRVSYEVDGLGVMLDLQSNEEPTMGLRVAIASGDAQRTADALRTLADQLSAVAGLRPPNAPVQ